jgi:two-component system, chemotaxis family, response regulator Rcp1
MSHTLGRIEILLVEDNLVDVQILHRCLRHVTFPYHLSVVNDAEAALAFLQRHAPYTEAPTPDLILLDIYLFGKSGWDILRWLKAAPALAPLPVVMLTGMLSSLDAQLRDRLEPTLCLEKPITVEGARDLTAILEEVVSQTTSSD